MKEIYTTINCTEDAVYFGGTIQHHENRRWEVLTKDTNKMFYGEIKHINYIDLNI